MIRPKSSRHFMYKPAHPLPREERPALLFANVIATTNCNRCGWPIARSALRDGWTPEGDYLYKHVACPTTRERAEMRRAALVSA